jgi:flagellin-like protein
MGPRPLGRRRRAVSLVVATLVLILVTLIAAAAVAGFVFGLMVTFTDIALVSAGTPLCSGTPEVCVVSLQNSGVGDAAITGTCTLRIGGNSSSGTASIQSGDLNAGSSAVVDCAALDSAHAQTGSAVTGWVGLQNGEDVLFYGTAS